MKKRFKIIIFLCILILILIIGFFLIKPLFTGKVLLTSTSIQDTSQNTNEYIYTKAICNESNYCQDYEIKCKNNETLSMTPITGAVIQHSNDWKDPRTQEEICK